MCGILGYVGNIPQPHQADAYRLLSELFKISVGRGKDASGFTAHLRDGSLVIDKRPIASPELVKRSKPFRKLSGWMPNAFIGHTRQTTSGTPSNGRNNHPFMGKRYSLVHNGVLRNWQDVARSLRLDLRTQTDSELLLRILEREETVYEAIQTIQDSVEGNMAIAAIHYASEDKKPRLFLFRNDDRPTYIVSFRPWNAIFFASTKELIETAIKFTWPNLKEDEIREKFGISGTEIQSDTLFQIYPTGEQQPLSLTNIEIKKKSKQVAYSSAPTCSPMLPQTINPPALPTNVIGGVSLHNDDTEDAMPNEDEQKMKAVESEIGEIEKILHFITHSSSMTQDEMKHWKKWRLGLPK